MSKVKFLTISSIVLLLINLGLIGFFLFGPHRRHHQEPKFYIIQKLGFDAEQSKHYEEIIKAHLATIQTTNAKTALLKEELYQSLMDEQKRAAKDSVINLLGQVQQEVELAHLVHFIELKAICTPEQLPKFNSLVTELGTLFSMKHHPPKKK